MTSVNNDLQLIQKVELRFALADTDEKFQSALDIYLAPLLLKFASNDKQVKIQLGKTIKFLLSKFNATPDLKLPSKNLLDQIKLPNLKPDEDATMVQSYSLLFLSKSIPRLTVDEKMLLFPQLLDGISHFKDSVGARLFNISCKILDSLDDAHLLALSSSLVGLKNETDRVFLAEKYFKFMLLHSISTGSTGSIPNNISQPGLSQRDCSFFFYYAGVTFNSATLSDYKLKILKFLEPVENFNKAIIVLCASCDGDSKISSYASTCLKRIPIEYEDKSFIDLLISLFVGNKEFQPVKPQLQEKILHILCKSKVATSSNSIENISSIGLNSSNLRLKQATVSFVKWFTTISSFDDTNDKAILKIGNQLKLNLADVSSDRSSLNYLDTRRYQYETLGLLLKKSKELLSVPYIQFLLDMLCSDDKELQPTILDALFGLTYNLFSLDDNQRLKLKNLFIDIFQQPNEASSNSSRNLVRFVAIKYVNVLFPFSDAESRIFDILAQSEYDKIETVEEAKKGLNPYLFMLNNNVSNKIEFPSFHTMIKYISKYHAFINMEVALNFVIRCLIMNSTCDKQTIVVFDEHWETRVDKCLELDSVVKKSLMKHLQNYHDINDNLTDDVSISSLKQFVDLSFDYVIKSNSLSVLILLTKIISLCPEGATDSFIDRIPVLLNNDLENISNESFHYISQLTGIICTTPKVEDKQVLNLLEDLIKRKSVSSIGYVISRLGLRGRSHLISNNIFEEVLQLIEIHLNTSNTKSLRMSLDCISQLSMFGCFGPVLSFSSKTEYYKQKYIEKLKPLVKKCLEPAIQTWAYLGLSFVNIEKSAEIPTVFEEILYETHNTKQIDNLFTSGEALAVLSDGWLSKKMSNMNDVPGTQISNVLVPDRSQIILDQILTYSKTTKPSLRKASCIWLLSLVQYSTSDIILERISEIQVAFMRFLSDREEIIQEAASRGLSIAYEKGGSEIQETLVHNLLKSFTDSNKTSKELMSGYVDNETQLFDEGVLNTGGGQSVSTYKDVLNLASEVGDPGLVYKFMSLAKNSALWSSKKGIAFGLSAILDKEKLDSLLKQNPKLAKRLIPKLFRYKYDPSTSISRTMNNIWDSLILENKVTLENNFTSIISELLTGMGNREWRIREASTAALQDLLRQVEFNKFENDLEKIWMMAFRAMDDIKASVRKEGVSLTKFLANVMVMKLNSTSNKSNQEAILKQLVPFFLGNNGLLSDSEDVKKFAFDTLMKLITTSSKSLKPFVAEIVKQMILLMSSVEPQVVNYLTLNADKYNLKVEDIDSQRLGIVGSSPMMEAIEKLMDLLDEQTISHFIEELGSAIKGAIGLPSKVAGSKVIVNLILRHFFIVSNYGDQLLKIAIGQLKDKNETVAKSYAIACGYCVRIASVKKIESLGRKITKYYFEKKSETSNDDKLPKISSIACEAISNFANDQFQSSSALFLPLAFIAKHDLNPEISKNFNKVWTDSTNSSVNALKLYFAEIISLIKAHIQTQILSLRKTIALAIIEIIDTLDVRINDLNPTYIRELYVLLLESLTGRIFDGKEKLLDSLVNLAGKSNKFLTKDDDLYNQVEARVITEASRKNKDYRKHSVIALGNFIHTYHGDPALHEKYIELIDELISSQSYDSDYEDDDFSNKMDIDPPVTIKISAAQINVTQNALLNVLYSISDMTNPNPKALHYVMKKTYDFFTNTAVDLLPNSDSKFKYKQGVLLIATKFIELNKLQNPSYNEKKWYTENVFILWEQIKKITGSTDNLQSTLVNYARVTGLLLEEIELNVEQREKCIESLTYLKSENVNSVITIECDKILLKFKSG